MLSRPFAIPSVPCVRREPQRMAVLHLFLVYHYTRGGDKTTVASAAAAAADWDEFTT